MIIYCQLMYARSLTHRIISICLVWCGSVCEFLYLYSVPMYLPQSGHVFQGWMGTMCEVERRTEVIIYVKGEVYLIPISNRERLIPIWSRLNHVLRPSELNAIGLHCFKCPTVSYSTLLCCVYGNCTQGDNQHYRPTAMLCPHIAIERCMWRDGVQQGVQRVCMAE